MTTNMIKNFPPYASTSEFIVVREVDNEYWFYGAYNRNSVKAYNVADEINGIVIHNVRI